MIKILLITIKKSYYKKLGERKDHRLTTVEEIFLMEKLTQMLRLQEAQME